MGRSMISRRAFFTFLAGGAALVGLPTVYFLRQISLCDMAWAFRNCKLQGGKFIFKYARYEGENPTVGWTAWINGEKYGKFITIDGIPTEEEATKITEVLQYDLDRWPQQLKVSRLI
ncbi:hypothetical protein LCGC14_1762660 [marine sediment metagenome]|uniref:Uncharacterized protein n=1 Tax=marine sediment metagenome TaxID=412755 RepID=A0A0F9H0I7_9ZZZZ